MDIARPDQSKAKRKKRIIYGFVVVVVVAGITILLGRLKPAAPTVDRNLVGILANLRVTIQSGVLAAESVAASAKADFETSKLRSEVNEQLAKDGLISDLDRRLSRVTAEQAATRNAIEQKRFAFAQDAVVAARPDIPIYNPAPLTKTASDARWSQRFFGGLMASFGALALFLAALGIYGVMAYSVSQRTQEIGVRMALGAPPRSVVLLILRPGLLLVLIGIALDFFGARFSAQRLASLLRGIQTHDPPTFAFDPLLLAGCLPSRRATRIAPNTALPSE